MAKKINYSVFIDGQAAEGTLRNLYNEKRKIQNALKDMKIGSDEYVKATGKYKQIDGQLKQHRENLGKVTTSQKELVQQTGLFSREITLLQGGMGKLKAGVALVQTSFVGLKGAIAATGIGALVIAIAALFSWLTKTKRGVEFMDRASAALGATFSVIVDRLSSLADSIIKAFENPKQSIKDLGQFIYNNIINRFTGLVDLVRIAGAAISDLASGDFASLKDRAEEAAQAVIQVNTGLDPAQQKAIADGIKGVANEISEEAKAAYELEGAMQRVHDGERELSVLRSRTRAQIKELNFIAEDTTRSDAERADAAQKAIEIEQSLMAKKIELAEENLRIIKEQNALGESLAEDLDKEAQAEIELNNIREESLEMQTTLNNKLNTIRQSSQAKLEKQHQEEMKLIEARAKKEEELSALIEQTRESLRLSQLEADEAELAQIDAKYAAMIEKAIGFDEQQRQLEALRDEEIAIKKEEQAAAKAEEEAKFLQEKQAFEDELYLMTLDSLDREQAELMMQYEELLAMAEQYGLDTTVIEQRLQDELTKIHNAAEEARTAKELEEHEKRLAATKEKAAAIAAIAQAGVDITFAVSELVGEETEIGAKLAKQAALFQIGLDTAKGVAAAVAGASAAAASTGPGAPFVITAYIATAVGSVLAGMAQTKKHLKERPPVNKTGKPPTLPPAYAAGGYTGSGFGSPDHTGHRPAGIVHEGEWVAPKWMTTSPRFADTIGYLESIRENGYAKGGFARFYEDSAKRTEGRGMIGELPEMSRTLERLTEVVEKLDKRIEEGIEARYDDKEVRSISKAQTEQNSIQTNLTIS